jgi:hypothetical protein
VISRTVIVILIYHLQKPIELVFSLASRRQEVCFRAVMLPESDTQIFRIILTRVRFSVPHGVVLTSCKRSSVEH